MKCLNCGTEFDGNFCPECGQSARIRRLAFKDFISDFPIALLNLERRFLLTIKAIFRNPYELTKQYSEGKRRFYASPLQLFFFLATFVFLLQKIFNLQQDPSLDASLDDAPEGTDDATLEIIDNIRFGIEKFFEFEANYTNYYDLGMPLVFGLTLALFARKRFNLAESISFSYFTFSMVNYLPFFLMLPFRSFFEIDNIQDVLNFLLIAYFCSFIGKRRVLNFFLGMFLFTFSVLFYAIIFVGVMTWVYW